MMKFGMQESELISWTAWHHACVEFFTNVLTINEKDAFQCTDCGPRPKVLVIDGIAMGIQKGELEKHKDIVVKDLPRKSKKEFSGSCFQDRMFIKLPKNRKLLKSAAQKKEWPVLDCHPEPDNHHEVEVAKKRPKLEHDDGMEKFCQFLRTFDKSTKPSRNFLTIMEILSTSTSTAAITQEYDGILLQKMKMYLEGDEQYNFVTGIANFDLNMQVRQQYPILLKILEGSLSSDGILGKPIRSDFHLYSNVHDCILFSS